MRFLEDIDIQNWIVSKDMRPKRALSTGNLFDETVGRRDSVAKLAAFQRCWKTKCCSSMPSKTFASVSLGSRISHRRDKIREKKRSKHRDFDAIDDVDATAQRSLLDVMRAETERSFPIASVFGGVRFSSVVDGDGKTSSF